MPTINANQLTLCHQGSQGVAMNTVPDVCKTQVGNSVVPIPYPNIAKDKDLVDGSETVLADGGNSIAIQGCKFSQSTGDQSGSLGGVSSGCTQGAAKFISFSPNVKVEGKPVCRLSDKMTMNKENAACMGGILIAPVVVPPLNVEHAEPVEQPENARNFKLTVLTALKNPVINVSATLTLSDDSQHQAISNEFGVAVFEEIPKDLEGEITYDDEDDFQAKSFAADMKSAVDYEDFDRVMRCLHTATDFTAIKSAYQANYGTDLVSAIKGLVYDEQQSDVIEYLLHKTQLEPSASITLIDED